MLIYQSIKVLISAIVNTDESHDQSQPITGSFYTLQLIVIYIYMSCTVSHTHTEHHRVHTHGIYKIH